MSSVNIYGKLRRMGTNGFLTTCDRGKVKDGFVGTWIQEGVESILSAAGTHAVRTYIGRRQATLFQCVALCPIFEVCMQQKIGYEVDRQRTPS